MMDKFLKISPLKRLKNLVANNFVYNGLSRYLCYANIDKSALNYQVEVPK